MSWLHAYLLTLAIEVPLAIATVRGSWRRVAVLAILASTLTHPLLTFVMVPYLPGPFAVRVVVGELVVIAIEAVVYRRGLAASWPYVLAVSALLNGTSFAVGLVIYG